MTQICIDVPILVVDTPSANGTIYPYSVVKKTIAALRKSTLPPVVCGLREDMAGKNSLSVDSFTHAIIADDIYLKGNVVFTKICLRSDTPLGKILGTIPPENVCGHTYGYVRKSRQDFNVVESLMIISVNINQQPMLPWPKESFELNPIKFHLKRFWNFCKSKR